MQDDSAANVLTAIRSVIGPGVASLHSPNFDGNEWRYVQECLESTYVSSAGKFVDRFESDLAQYTGSKYVVAVVNGTAALHISLKLAGVKSNEEVLLPALTFVATANAVTYCNAIPHFVESEVSALGIDVPQLRDYLKRNTEQSDGKCRNRVTGRVIRALVPMHTFGHIGDMDGLLAISRDFNIVLVEDAAEALGSFYNGQHAGTFGLFGTLSFNGNKIITTGGGGAILTNNSSFARKAKHLTTTAKVPHAWSYFHDEIGYNYRLPNLNAALGCAQLERLPNKLSSKRRLFSLYRSAFEKIKGAQLLSEPKNCQSNYWLQTLILDSETGFQLEELLKITNANGVMTRPVWTLMDELAAFKNCPSMRLDSARELANRLINVPSSPSLIEVVR
jgi:aminotransferase in exopolysaccharide biosynthesis